MLLIYDVSLSAFKNIMTLSRECRECECFREFDDKITLHIANLKETTLGEK